MTSRIKHSLGGMRRLLQMTAKRVSIFVEGRDLDPNFYSRLCGPVCRERGLPYEIIIADRITGGGGGKSALVNFFELLRRKKALLDRTGPISKVVMFYVDKDTDDIFRTKRRSGHVVYTSRFCVENHLFCEGDLAASIATGGSVDLEVLRARIPNPELWRRNAAVRWQEWIALCLTAQKLRLAGQVSYSVNHSSVDSRVNPANLATCLADLQTRSGKSAPDFNRIITWARNIANRYIRQGEHDLVFKGKWYVVFAMHELEQVALAVVDPINLNGAKDRLIGSLIATVRFDDAWAEHFREPLRRAINAL
jgi:hypothetical protein